MRRTIWVNVVCIPKLRNKSVWHDQIKYCPNNLKNMAINPSSSLLLTFNTAPSRTWFGCNIRQNLIGKTSVEQLNIIRWFVSTCCKIVRGKLYNWTEWCRWSMFLWVPGRYSRRSPLFKLQRGCRLTKGGSVSNKGKMLDSKVKPDSHVKSSL